MLDMNNVVIRKLKKIAIIRYLLNVAWKLAGILIKELGKRSVVLYFVDIKTTQEFSKYLNNEPYIYEKEIELLPKILSFGDNVFDVGANIGQYAYYLSKIVGEAGAVYSFEPGKRAYRMLTSTVKRYHLNNVQTFKIAISNISGEATLYVPSYKIGHAQLENKNPVEGKREICRTATLDELFYFNRAIQNLRFIKCDCEGAELKVFQGAINLLKKEKPIILCEIAEVHLVKFVHSVNAVVNFLKELGYKCFTYDYAQKILIPTSEINLKGGHVWSKKDSDLENNNYIFIHKSDISNLKTCISLSLREPM